jgi:ribose transport system ATP-binding protein
MGSENILLEMRGIEKGFPGVKALQNIDFDLYPGEVHCLVGENGAGKSTLIKIISGVYQSDLGQIFLNGEGIQFHNPHFAQQMGINTVYQELDLVPTLNIAENIFLGKEFTTSIGLLDKKRAEEESKLLLRGLGISFDVKQRIQDLGITYQQLVAIARALSRKSKILIFDEPSAALSLEQIKMLFDTIRTLKDKGIGIIYISHRLEEIFQIGDRVTILRDGKLIKTSNVKDLDLSKLIGYVIGRSLQDQYVKERVEIGGSVFAVKGLSRKGILNDINFRLNKGEILGFCGLTGSGRTEVARSILGIDPKDSGDIFIDGQKVSIKSPAAAIELGIGLIPEDRKEQGVVLCRPVGENISLPLLRQICSTPLGIINRRLKKDLEKEYISRLNIITPSPQHLVQNLSGGNQQKVVLAKWLASRCKILIFDEPTRGIDVGAKREIYSFMHDLVREGVSIIMISSELPELLALSDRILIMSEGSIVEELSFQVATQEKLLERMGKRVVS